MSNFTREVTGDVVVECVNIERATMKEAEEFKQLLVKDIYEGFKKIVVDLKSCSFMDSTFLGALIIALKELHKTRGDLKIAAAHSDAEAILEITGTSKIFEQYKTREEAVNSFTHKDVVG